MPPGPGDESLCIGAAYYHYKKLGYKTFTYLKPLKNAYLGQNFDEKKNK